MTDYVQLGSTGLTVSNLCLGTMTFGNQCDQDASFAIMDAAIEHGITFFDTADMYPATGPADVGLTEEIMGRWLAARGEDIVLATKFWGPTGVRPWQRGGNRKHVMEACEGSLRRLGVDCIDLYQIHFPDHRTPIEETLGALADLVQQGKVRYIGCSNYPAWELAWANGRADKAGLPRFDCVQPRYNLLFRAFERDLFPLCERDGIGVIPYNPLAGGLLTGKHKRAAPEDGSRFTLGQQGERYMDRYWHDLEHDAVDELRGLSVEVGISMAQLAVAWTLAEPAVTSPIVGATRPEQLDDAVAATNEPLAADVKERLDALSRQFRLSEADR